jgi:cyclopropane fatty-acyl-phospholipid synthase-like methyltransferase
MHFGYQKDRTTDHSASLINAIENLAEIAEVRAGDRVLDAGCGIGGSSLWLARERNARAVGIALGIDQVNAARRSAKRTALSAKARFLVADFTALPFPAMSFDVVWAQESLCHANDKHAFFEEAARVLARGGRIVVADFMLRRPSVDAENKRLLEDWFDGWAMPGLWTAAEHVNAAKAAGLRSILIHDITRYTLPSHRRLYERARWAMPIASLLQATGLRNTVQDGNIVASLRQYQTLRRDCWFYAILSARKP